MTVHGPIHVLVVEDDPVAADVHALYVGRVPGFTPAGVVHSGAEVLRCLERGSADLLLDLHLPDGHGLQLVRSLRAAGHTADVIAVTSARDLVVVRQGVSLGVVQYVLKPFTFAALRDRLVRYAAFRVSAGEASGQDEVDRALAALRPPQPVALPKGLSGPTLEAVKRALRSFRPQGVTAAAAGEVVGVTRITARRSTWWGRAGPNAGPSTGRWAARSSATAGSARVERNGRSAPADTNVCGCGAELPRS